jgi:HCOMODA/2-hydroxy-3-carboxy-muconic semialdehyde decarboxylase
MKKLLASKALVDDLVAANRILAAHEVLDAYGHVSARSDKRPERFLMSRSRAPALVTAADLMELDADSEALPGDKRKGFIERYLHGEIYRARPDVMAVVHSHSPSVIPFGITRTRLRPVYHMGSFLWSGAPVWDIRKVREDNDVLVRDRPLGKALAGALGSCNCVLMRGHGMTVIGDSIPEAVFRAIYSSKARSSSSRTRRAADPPSPTAARSSGLGRCGRKALCHVDRAIAFISTTNWSYWSATVRNSG